MHADLLLRSLRTLLDGLVRLSQTRGNYWAEFLVDGLLVLSLLGAGLRSAEIAPQRIILTFLAGLLIFSFIEYAIHRWLFHRINSVLSQGHNGHHRQPTGYDSLPFFLPTIVAIGMLGIASIFLPDSSAYLLTGAIMTGYLIYGLSHHFIHHVRYNHPWVKRWAALHHIHHVHPGTNFGVTSPLWDILLGTRYVPPRRR